MCFILKTEAKRKPRPRIAKEDIIVFKVITYINRGVYYNLHINGVTEQWTPGFEYIEDTPFRDTTRSEDRFEFGGHCFHSKQTNYEAEKFRSYDASFDSLIVKMIIPKGALYYKNDTDYISNRLIYPNWEV